VKEAVVTFGQAHSLVGIITDPSQQQRNGDLPAMILLTS